MIENINELVGTEYSAQQQLLDTLKVQPNCFVGWIDNYNSDTKTATIQPAIQNEIYDKDNAKVYINKPFIVNVWIVANTLTREPKRGDKALIWVLDEKSNNFFKSKYTDQLPIQQQTIVNPSKSYKTMSNCVAIVVNPDFVAGETEIEWGKITGDISDQTDLQDALDNLQTAVNEVNAKIETVKKRYVTETWVSSDGFSWYTIYNDGWKECGGQFDIGNSTSYITITLPVAFSNTSYTVLQSPSFVSPSGNVLSGDVACNITGNQTIEIRGYNNPKKIFACGY